MFLQHLRCCMDIVLPKTELFEGVSRAEAASLLDCLGAAEAEYGKGELILAEGDTTENVGLVLSGMALISVAAAEDTRVLFLNVGRLLTTCDRACPFHARLARNLLFVCAQKSLQLSRKILHTSPKTIRGRLMSYFSDCARRAGDCSFTLPYNRQQLADYLGVDRSAMCGELTKMRRDGLIDCSGRRIFLKF